MLRESSSLRGSTPSRDAYSRSLSRVADQEGVASARVESHNVALRDVGVLGQRCCRTRTRTRTSGPKNRRAAITPSGMVRATPAHPWGAWPGGTATPSVLGTPLPAARSPR